MSSFMSYCSTVQHSSSSSSSSSSSGKGDSLWGRGAFSSSLLSLGLASGLMMVMPCGAGFAQNLDHNLGTPQATSSMPSSSPMVKEGNQMSPVSGDHSSFAGESGESSSSGRSACQGRKALSGLHVGLEGGLTNLDTKVYVDWVRKPSHPDHLGLSSTNGMVGLRGGYTHFFSNNMGAGIDVFGRYSPVKGKTEVGIFSRISKYSFSLEQKESFGGTVRVGGLVTDQVFGYVHLGYVNTKWKGISVFTPSDPVTSSKNQNGILYGVGMQVAVSPRFSVAMEYHRTDYTKMKWHHIDDEIQIRPKTNTVLLTVKMKVKDWHSFGL